MRYVRLLGSQFVLSPRGDGWPTHHDIARTFRPCGHHPISAGFVDFTDGQPVCFGRSESLDLASGPDDSAALAEWLGL